MEVIKKDIGPNTYRGDKTTKRNRGKIVLKAFESDICQTRIKFQLSVEEIAIRNMIFITIKGSSNNKEFFQIHSTEPKKVTSKGCTFTEFSVNSNKIGEESSMLKFELYESKKNEVKLIGELEIRLIELYNKNNKKISIYRNTFIIGKLRAILKKDDHNNFLNYMYDGCCLKTLIAVDFCAKKGDLGTQDELDDIKSAETINLYKSAIRAVGTLLKYYDDDFRTTALGFGAKLPPYFNVVSHCFALNQNYFDPVVGSLDEVCELLQDAANKVQLHGPKIISECIKYATDLATELKRKDARQYIVLLILTDGKVNDYESTRQLLAGSEHLPLSVMLIKVSKHASNSQEAQYGKADRDRMDRFEALARGVGGQMAYSNPSASVGASKLSEPEIKRQNFCYMQFTKAMADLDKNDGVVAEKTFKDIPKQFLEYMIATNYQVKKMSDNKATNSKREIKKELEARKSRNQSTVHPVTAYLEALKNSFVREAKSVGYNGAIVDQVVNSGIQAMEFNLLAENVAAKEKQLEEEQEQPINIPTLASDKDLGRLPKQRSLRVEISAADQVELKKLEPQVIKVFTKDKVPQKKFQEWNNKKNEAYMATQQMLVNIEKEQMEFWERYLPASITSQYKNKKEKVHSAETKEVELRLDRADQIDPFLDSQKVKFDEKYGIRTAKGSRCLFCSTRDISIILMNCGHAICCLDCKPNVKQVCPICGVKVSYMIQASQEQTSQRFVRQPSSVEDLDKVSNIVREEADEDDSDDDRRLTPNKGRNSTGHYPSPMSHFQENEASVPRGSEHQSELDRRDHEDDVHNSRQNSRISSSQLSASSTNIKPVEDRDTPQHRDHELPHAANTPARNNPTSKHLKPVADPRFGISEVREEMSGSSVSRLSSGLKHKPSSHSFVPNEPSMQNFLKKDSGSQARSSAVFGQGASKHGQTESGANLIEPDLDSHNQEEQNSSSSSSEHKEQMIKRPLPKQTVPKQMGFTNQLKLRDEFSDEVPLKDVSRSFGGPGQLRERGSIQDGYGRDNVLGHKKDIFEVQDSEEDSEIEEKSRPPQFQEDDESQLQEFGLGKPGANQRGNPSKPSVSGEVSRGSKSISSQSRLSGLVSKKETYIQNSKPAHLI